MNPHPGEGEAQSIRLPENYRKNVVAIFHQKIFASLQTLSGDNSESFGKRSPSRLPQPSIKLYGFMVVHASGNARVVFDFSVEVLNPWECTLAELPVGG